MPEQINSGQLGEQETSTSGLLLSVEPLHESGQLNASDTADTDASDDTTADADGSDEKGADTDLTDALGNDAGSDADSSDANADTDSSDTTLKIDSTGV